jgi:hypothetical protein
MLTIHEHLGSPLVFGGARVAHPFSCLCYVVFFCALFVLCRVYPILLVSLDCPFLLGPSVFSNVYLPFVKKFIKYDFQIIPPLFANKTRTIKLLLLKTYKRFIKMYLFDISEKSRAFTNQFSFFN